MHLCFPWLPLTPEMSSLNKFFMAERSVERSYLGINRIFSVYLKLCHLGNNLHRPMIGLFGIGEGEAFLNV